MTMTFLHAFLASRVSMTCGGNFVSGIFSGLGSGQNVFMQSVKCKWCWPSSDEQPTSSAVRILIRLSIFFFAIMRNENMS